ncbi:MAG: dephospho-CoA kinase [Verrucomicrobia bacterium]|nr:dephospho-CoA kinase [Verrucomicrobiota bacterium]
MTPTKIFGLTGGIGMGKSAVAQLLERRGVPVVDTDVLARKVVEPGQPALAAIQEMFGGAVLAQDGSLRRDELARRVFASDMSRKQLEAILHPRIRALWQAQVDQWRTDGVKLGVVVIPLLFETNAARHFDKVICVACSAASQQQRLAARGWSAEQIQQRISAQWPSERKLTQADYVIWTEGSPEVTVTQVDRILAEV